MKNLKLKQKLIGLFLVLGILPVLVLAIISIINSSSAIEQLAFNQLVSVQKMKHNEIARYFEQRKSDISVYAKNSAVVEATQRFINAFNESGLNGDKWQKWKHFHGPKFKKYIDAYGYYDLFIISNKGDIVFSVTEEPDLGQNLISGSLSKSGLAEVFNKGKSDYALSDVKWYYPSNQPASFISHPVINESGELAGVLAYQLSMKQIDEIMHQREGMGETGEIYLVGSDFRMRSDSYIDPSGHSVVASFKGNVDENGVKTPASEKAVKGESGAEIINDYHGNSVLSVYAPLDLSSGIRWAVIAEIDKDEAFAKRDSLVAYSIVILSGVMVVILFAGYYLGNKIAKPVIMLANSAKEVANGNTDIQLEVESNDEFGELAASFNLMVESLEQRLGYINDLPTPVMLIDTDYTIQYMNKAGARILGKTQQELTGQKCYENFKTDHCNTDKCACTKAMKLDNIFNEETVSRAGAEDLPITYTGAPIKDKQGNIIGALEAVMDIKEIKDLQSYLQRSTQTILNAMNKFAQGDLTVKVECERDGDDISQLFCGFNDAVAKIKKMITEVQDAVEATASASAEISSSSEQMAAGAQEQSAQAGEVATAIEQMTSTILETTGNTQAATDVAKQAGDKAKEGVKRIEETRNGMEKIVESSESTGKIISALTEKADQIGEIALVIDDIADQTNLLALNAAIEAARAGEQGRGFAVVADEVRKLAERTTKATKEIANTIKGIQEEVKEAGNAMDVAKSSVYDGINLDSASRRCPCGNT